MGGEFLMEACGVALVIGGAAGVASVAGMAGGWRPRLGFVSMCSAGIACAAGLIVMFTPWPGEPPISAAQPAPSTAFAGGPREPAFERAPWPRAELPRVDRTFTRAASSSMPKSVPRDAGSSTRETFAGASPVMTNQADRLGETLSQTPQYPNETYSADAWNSSPASQADTRYSVPATTTRTTAPTPAAWGQEPFRSVRAMNTGGVPMAPGASPAQASPVYVPVPMPPGQGMNIPPRPRAMLITRGASPVVLVLE